VTGSSFFAMVLLGTRNARIRNSSIWSIRGNPFESAVHLDRILTESGFWATHFGTPPAEGVTCLSNMRMDCVSVRFE
jgi:hypothetical protein